jgi:spectinomycin phosphotransferase
MRDRPTGIEDQQVADALAEGWRIEVTSLQYAPVGGGSYHWIVHDRQGETRFVTVDDLDDKPWLGLTRSETADGLRAAMTTATELRRDAGLAFVVAPIPGQDGSPLMHIGARHSVAVFPHINGSTGRSIADFADGERNQVVDLLAELHRAAPPSRSRPSQMELPQRGVLEALLAELGAPWESGPFAEPVRLLLAANADRIRQMLATFDRLAGPVAASPEQVITHGEPHSGNIMRAKSGLMLIDWDTVGLAPPERDLWMLVTDGGCVTSRYTTSTGREVDQRALEFYRIRWALDDISSFAGQLRAGHRRTAHTEHIWQAVQTYLGDPIH